MGNVILTGFMGSGKSSVAIKLSYRLKKAVIDTDKLIEKKQGKTITKIFEEDGEEVFRQLETETLRSLKTSSRNDIISVGGGTPMREENRALMKELGTVVYLRVSAETVFERVKADNNRPLLQCEDPQGKIRELLEKREPLYEEGAHVIIDADGKNYGQILFEIERAVRSREMEMRSQHQDGFRKEGYRKEEFQNDGFRKDGEHKESFRREYHKDGYMRDGQRPYGERRTYSEQKNYGEQRNIGGFNGFRRFSSTAADDAAAENGGQSVSQHAQNIQFALNESAQRQERWQRRSYQNYEAKEQEEEKKDAAREGEAAAAEEAVAAEDTLAVAEGALAAEDTLAVAEEALTAEAAKDAEIDENGNESLTAEAADEVCAVSESIEPVSEKKRPTRLLVINGPNLNFLGIREKGIYGSQDYNYLLNLIAGKGIECGVAIEVFQSNHEGAIIDRLQASYFDGTEGIVINPGAYTHYSYAIRDALASLTVPKVEVHISNIMEREPFRQVSVTAPVCDKQIYGQGLDGYLQAIDFILNV